MMAGGKSKRLGLNKLLLNVCGLPLVWIAFLKYKRVCSNLKVAISKNMMSDLTFLKFLDAEIIETPGMGYSEDVSYLLNRFKEPVLLLSADSVYLKADQIKYFLSITKGQSMSAAVKLNDKIVYVGMNYAVPGCDRDIIILFKDKLLSYSINVIDDLEVFKKWLWQNGCYSLLQ
ncbi:MAG: NTP transferase domain-containing protein [Nitrososphaeria archaeon]